MRFVATDLAGVWLVEPVPITDPRGFFARTFCIREYAEMGLETEFVQHSLSRSERRGTLRGLHFQHPPHAEVKVVSCTSGAIWDVAVDLRPTSPSYGRWQAFDLRQDNHAQLYIPKGVAHGFQTLSDGAEVSYLISEFHVPEAAAGIRYDDPTLAIPWPFEPMMMSERDLGWPSFALLEA